MNHPAAVAGASALGVIAIGEAAFGGAKLATFSSPCPAADQAPKIIYKTLTAKPSPTPAPAPAPVTSAAPSPSHDTENADLSRREIEA
ncbi:MAG TPA: hypothetical protein VF070_20190 [Streptosporangiaceae bacterium]